MSKVTSKLQVTLPKSIAERFNIKPGDQIEWEAAGETIRVVPARKRTKSTILPQDRLKHFDQQRNDSGNGKRLSTVRCSLLLLRQGGDGHGTVSTTVTAL